MSVLVLYLWVNFPQIKDFLETRGGEGERNYWRNSSWYFHEFTRNPCQILKFKETLPHTNFCWLGEKTFVLTRLVDLPGGKESSLGSWPAAGHSTWLTVPGASLEKACSAQCGLSQLQPGKPEFTQWSVVSDQSCTHYDTCSEVYWWQAVVTFIQCYSFTCPKHICPGKN